MTLILGTVFFLMKTPPIFLVNYQACVVPVATGAKKVCGSITSSI